MPVITFDDFVFGLDRRESKVVSDTNRMRELKNGYVTTGKVVKKRPGTVKVITLSPDTKGLSGSAGTLNIFTRKPTPSQANSILQPRYFQSGVGLNDMSSGGTYTGARTAVFQIEIDATGSPDTFRWKKDKGAFTSGVAITGAAQTLQDGLTVTFGATTGHTLNDKWFIDAVVFTANQIVNNNVSSAVGTAVLDDMTALNSAYEPTGTATFDVEIDGTGTPDTFKWRKDGGSYTIEQNIVAGDIALQDGIFIQFGATTGHTLTDNWTITVSAEIQVEEIHFVDSFNGFLYVASEFVGGELVHHYLDGVGAKRVTDVNCPNSKGVLKMEQKIWAVDGDTVAFSKTGDPEDWTAASNAGFIAVGLHQEGADNALALGQYQRKQMVVFFLDGAQLWNVDPDPAAHSLAQVLSNTRSQYHKSLEHLSNDLVYLSDSGFRSIAEEILSDNQKEEDIGTPIDNLVTPLLAPSKEPISIFYPDQGQYWCSINDRVFVYTFSRSNKIAAWSEYEFPWAIDDWTLLDGKLYFRSGDDIHKLDESKYRDSGASLGVAVFAPKALISDTFDTAVVGWTTISPTPLPLTYEGVVRWHSLGYMELFSGGDFEDTDDQWVCAAKTATTVASRTYTVTFDVYADIEMRVNSAATPDLTDDLLVNQLYVVGSHSVDFTATNTTSNIVFCRIAFGSGLVDNIQVFEKATLNDASFSGAYTGSPDAVFTVEIDGEGTPDTFKWKKDDGSYTSGVSLTGMAQLLSDGVSVTFSNSTGHRLGDAWSTKTGDIAYEFKMVMPYAHAKKPGVLKIWHGADVAFGGTGMLSFKYDTNDESFETTSVAITGDSQPGTLLPVELSSTGIAPVVTNDKDEEFQVDQISLHYTLLGAR